MPPVPSPPLPDPWSVADPFGEVLHELRMTGTLYCRSDLSAPWGFTLPPVPGCLMVHAVTAGHALLAVGDQPPLPLGPGDLALVPHGEGHALTSGSGAAAPSFFTLPRREVNARYEILRHGGGGEPTVLVCAVVRCERPAAAFLIRALPHVLHVPAQGPEATSAEAALAAEWVRSTLRLMDAEARALRPGGETVLTRLADVLVVQAVRVWLASDPTAQMGWLGALRDAHVGPALAAIHREPGHAWTVEALAATAALSRSAFAERFAALVGEPPFRYLTRWRMALAPTLLAEEGLTVGEAADRLGYGSETAFSRAFHRVHGVPPGSVFRDRP